MISLEQINSELIKSDSDSLEANFVAIAVQLNSAGIPCHSGLIIGVNGKYSLFHFTGSDVEIRDIPSSRWFFHKHLEFIQPDESLSFLAHCELISENSVPFYGYVFSGSYYEDGAFISSDNLKEIATCVSFCINVISGFLIKHKEYFKVDDWPPGAGMVGDNYFEEQFAARCRFYVGSRIEDYKPFVKRISPLELTSSAFADGDKLPIRKEFIDSIIENVRESLRTKFTP